MTSIIYKYECTEPPFDQREALRYAGMRAEDDVIGALLCKCYEAVRGILTYRACYRELSVDEPAVKALLAVSESARTLLSGCDAVVFFAATVGGELDRAIARVTLKSCTEGLLTDAVGAERIESLCDSLCEHLSLSYGESGRVTTRRFSPGYGDIPLSAQREIFALLDCQRRIGLTLNESLLMSPSKSVSAIVGIRRK